MSSLLSAQHSIHEGFYFLEISSLINLPWPTLMKKSLQVTFMATNFMVTKFILTAHCVKRQLLGLGGGLVCFLVLLSLR